MKIKIGPKIYRLDERTDIDVKPDIPGRVVAAYIDYDDESIVMRRDLRNRIKLFALVHEIVHGFDYELQLGLNEVQTGLVATVVSSFLADNVPFLRWALKVLDTGNRRSKKEGRCSDVV